MSRREPTARRPLADPALHLALVHPEIPGNTGNVGRTCLAAGARLHLVRPLGFRLDEKAVRRAGLDYWPRVEPTVWASWGAFAEALPELGEPYLFSSGAERSYWQVRYRRPTVLIFGCESEGLPAEILQRYPGRRVAFPMADSRLRSLNLSTSAGLGLYEVLRQRREERP